MARPSTAQIFKKNIIGQFQEWSIKTIKSGVLEQSGFTYDPAEFMKNGSKLKLNYPSKKKK